ncbi:helicase domain protein (plasmid) [Leptolyngbya sp. NIES-3755]|nr:helicase domain protein [Leptolyngbya sp. NIES-3755]
MSNPQLVSYFATHFSKGGSFSTIVAARQQASLILNQPVSPGTALAKLVDESVEAGIIRAARQIVETSGTIHEAYDRLVKLHDRQPVLNVRSSTSILQQAYSTPIPIAFLASVLAKIDGETSVYEPTAGHGALLISANPANATVNEINPERAADLRSQGFTVTEHDATEYQPHRAHDRVICNPPFGVVKIEGQTKRFQLPGNPKRTPQVDQAIALLALQSLKDDGRAVLILGGKLGDEEETRSNRYNTLESRNFYATLYEQYNVTQHLSIWGSLYRKQGAGFPIDLIVIEGRGRSQQMLPAAAVPTIYKSFSQLKELIRDEQLRKLSPNLETSSDGRLGVVHHQTSSRNEPTNPIAIQDFSSRTHHLADPNLDGTDSRNSGTNASQIDDRTARSLVLSRSTETNRVRYWGTRFAAGVDGRLGRDVYRTQRNADAEIISRLPDHATSDRATDAESVAERTQQNHLRELVSNPDLRHEYRLLAIGTEAMVEQAFSNNPIESNVPTQSFDIPYIPRSKGQSAQNLIPTNMAAAAQIALDHLEQNVGNIDEFVAQRLGYNSTEQMWQYLYAEQIDAIAFAFHQRDRGNIFLNGDKTGNGKGRFGAANIVDAARQGYIPVFVTQKANLYTSMLTDLADIGKPGMRVFATDNKLGLDLEDGRKLVTGDAAAQEDQMRRIMQQGLGNYNAIFTTYTQLQTVQQKEPFRREFFRTIAPQAVFIFDESHEAGGRSDKSQDDGSIYPSRAEFVRELVDTSAGATFMSATAIKNAGVVDLYARRSDARYAVDNLYSLETILKDGGVPLQQMFATKFVASGQMLRRSRSMEGISFTAKVVPVDRDIAEGISAVMRAINDFDDAKQAGLNKLKKRLKAEAKALSEDGTTGAAGARSTNFTSLMHNAIDQSLLAQKAEVAVQEAIAAIERGEKPLIGVANTMDSFIEWYTEENNIDPGQSIEITFGDVLDRYLERSRDVIESDRWGKKTRRRLTDEEIGPDAVAAYEEAQDLIEETDLSSIPLSSIDYIRWRLTEEGYRVDEITGRSNIVEYSHAGDTSYGLRPSSETSPQARVDIINRFNRGDLDVIILNRSGATGINLHASEKFADQRPRRLIIAQAERDINLVMQLFGRIDRYGQVVKPSFDLLMSDLPAEKRLGALLAKKMAELNANVTASRDSQMSVANVVDFMNVYGEEVVRELLEEDYELQAKLSYPLDVGSDDSDIAVIKRVTGRIPLLTIQEQEELYTLIETETRELIVQKEAMGESVLKADQLDLDARTIAQMEVIPDESGVKSEFTGAVALEVVDAKVPVKPFSQLQVINAIRQSLELPAVENVADHDFEAVTQIANQRSQELLTNLREETRSYRREMLPTKHTPGAKDRFDDKLKDQFKHLTKVLRQTPPGTPVRVVSPEGNVFYGVIIRISQKGHKGSPIAPTNWKAQILVDHRCQQLTIPLSKFNRGKDDAMTRVTQQATNWNEEDIYAAFDLRQQQNQRTEMQIFTGNPIRAYEKYPNGRFLNYTNDRGNVVQGLIMPAGFDIQEALRAEPVAFKEPAQVKAFLTDATRHQASVKTLDELLTIRTQASMRLGSGNATGFVLQTPKSGAGDQYSLDTDIITAAGTEFYSVAERMELIVPHDRIDQVLSVILQEKRWTLAAFDYKEQARDLLDIKLPELTVVQPVQNEARQELISTPEKVKDQTASPETDQTIPLILVEPILDDFSRQPQSMPEQEDRSSLRVVAAKNQSGRAEKNIARFLEQAGLSDAVMADSEFYLQIENSPYIPLTIERHDAALHFIHWLEDSYGDLFIDSEMIFEMNQTGHLTFREVAVQNPVRGGELRSPDRSFAQLFSRNILDQGFAEAARQMETSQTVQPAEVLSEAASDLTEPRQDNLLLKFGDGNTVRLEPEEVDAIARAFYTYTSDELLHERLAEILEPVVGKRNIGLAVQAVIENYQQSSESHSETEISQSSKLIHDTQQANRANLAPFAIEYLNVKDQHPNDLVFQRCASGDFYTAYFDDATTIATALDLTLTSRDAGGTVGRVPSISIPAWSGAIERFITYLKSQGHSVIVDQGIHQSEAALNDVETTLNEQSNEPSQTPELEQESEAIAESTTLFDLRDYSEAERDYQVDVQGHDPTWESDANNASRSSEVLTSTEPDLETQITTRDQATSPDSSVQPRTDITPSNSIDVSALTNEVRNFDLEAVAASLGLQKDRRDKNKWKDAGHTVSINDGKFMDWLADKGGGGAIDLVMHVRKVEFKEAVQWLSGQTLSSPARSQSFSVPKEPRPLELPPHNEEYWATVRQYLVETRGLPTTWIDRFHETGLIYADDYRNAVFLRYSDRHNEQAWSRHEATGASLRGTRDSEHAFHGLAPGSCRENGWFWLRSTNGEVNRAVLTESPIDAISLAVLEKEKSPNATTVSVYLSTDGSGAIPTTALQAVLDKRGQVIAAFDADKPGEKMAWRIAEMLPGITRMTPAQGKDWNDRLLIEHHSEQAKTGEYERGDKETLRSLWKWHRVAGELGRSPAYLKRITEVARAVVDGEPLSDKAVSAMQQDFQTYKQQVHTRSTVRPNLQTSEVPQAQTAQAKKSYQGVEMG